MNTDLRERLEDACLAHGTCPTEALLDRLEAVAEEAGFEVGGRLLGDLIARLDVRQRHLWTALLNQGDALAVIAADVGVSPQAMHRQVDRLRKRLMRSTQVDEQHLNHTPPGARDPGKIQTRPQGRR
jgi:hypothetical protein